MILPISGKARTGGATTAAYDYGARWAPEYASLRECKKAATRLEPAATYPRFPKEANEDMKWTARAQKAEATRTWTTSVHGLEQDRSAGGAHIQEKHSVSPIQCGLCASHAIPALQLCHWCFPEIVANICVMTINQDGAVKY